MTRRTLVGGGVRVPSRRSCLFFLSAAAWAYVPGGKRIPRAWECDPSAQGAADGGANAGARPAPSYRVDSKSRAFSFFVLKCRGFLPLRDQNVTRAHVLMLHTPQLRFYAASHRNGRPDKMHVLCTTLRPSSPRISYCPPQRLGAPRHRSSFRHQTLCSSKGRSEWAVGNGRCWGCDMLNPP